MRRWLDPLEWLLDRGITVLSWLLAFAVFVMLLALGAVTRLSRGRQS